MAGAPQHLHGSENPIVLWTWKPITPAGELDVAGPNASPERRIALELLAGLPNAGSRGVYRRDVNYFLTWWQADYAPVLLQSERGDPRPPIEAKRPDLEQFLLHLGSLEEPISPATINRRIAVVSSFYERACEDEDLEIEVNPCSRLKRPKIDNDARSGLSAPEAGQLLRTAREWPDDTEGTVVLLLLLVGLRVSEAVSLTSDQVIRDGGHVKIDPVRKGKDGRQLLVVDEPDLANRLTTRAKTGGRLFPGLSRFAAARAVAKLGKAAGLEQPLFPHLLRHTFVTQLLRSGIDIETVRDLAGHSSIDTTQRYAKAIDAESSPVSSRLASRYEVSAEVPFQIGDVSAKPG